jgi:hypothetical protein|tara:strand:+ start:2279 stop:3202 length:924 start_codon:yes stop_codon:yes gene_type:complete
MSHQDTNLDWAKNMDEVFGKTGWRQIQNYKIGERREMKSEEISPEMVEVVAVDEPNMAEIQVAPSVELATNIFGTTNPKDFVAKSQEYASALVEVVENQNLFALIQGKKYVTFEGWQFLGSMLPTAITPQTEWTVEVKDENTGEVLGFKTRVVAKDVNGNERGAAESVCMYSESNWRGKDANHLMSMAQTRASSKALRMALSSIVKLAGFEPTPKEEMDGINAGNSFNSNKQEFKKTIPNPDTPATTSGKDQFGRVATEKQINFLKKLVMQNPDHVISQDPKVIEGLSTNNLDFEIAKSSIDKLLNN